MSRQAASGDGWIRVARRDGIIAVSGRPRHFKGYACSRDGQAGGVFASWDWDGRRLQARTCLTGFLPLFYYMDSSQVVLSTRVADIFAASGHPPRLCPAALGLLLRLGFLVGDYTPFEGVKVLGPDGTLEWTPGALPVVRSSCLEPQAPADPGDAGLRARYAELFRESMAAIAAILSDAFAVPLSGGRDSRHIALELHRMGRPPLFALTARHLAPRNNEDARIAAMLCEAMGWKHVLVDQPLSGAFARECEHAGATDYLSFEHAWTLPLRDALVRSDATEVFDGVGGDVLSAGLFQDEAQLALYRDGRMAELAYSLLAKWSILGGEDGLAASLGEDLAAARDPGPALALLESELARHAGQPNPLKSFYFWNRSRRGTGLLPFKVLGSRVAYAPYLHPPLLRFLLALDPAATRDRTLHTDTIRLAGAQIGTLPYEDKSAPAATRRGGSRGFHASLLASGLRSRGTLRAGFVVPRAARSWVLGSDPHAAWWKPKRIAYLAGLARFVKTYRIKQPCC